jgi:hypothetical protein
MAIRSIAADLYRVIQDVEKLEQEIFDAPFEKQEALHDQLRRLKADRDQLRRLLDGKKDPPSYHRRV